MKQAVICVFFGKLRDRFCEYGEELTVVQKLERIARIPGVEGVEIVWPHELQNLAEVKETLARLKLTVSAVNVNIKSDPEFVRGALASPDTAVRRRAVDYIKAGKEAALALGADRITCCPLSDGYDYAFQTHHTLAWQRMVEAVREAAAHLPKITLFLEFKPWETRVQGLLTSSSKTILLCQAAGWSTGVTIDIGHSTFGGESPAHSLALVAAHGLPYYIHTNDNNGKWDWDLLAGACNVWEYLEFLFYLKELRYDGWITSDVAPFRQNPSEIYALNVRFTAQLWRWLDTIDRGEIRAALERNDYMFIRQRLDPHIFHPPGFPAAGAGVRS